MRLSAALEAHLAETLAKFTTLAERLVFTSAVELYRRFLAMVEWRLEASLEPGAGGYRDGSELTADLELILRSLRETPAQPCARVFGLHLASLDIRQDSRRHAEIFAILGLSENFDALPEDEKLRLLSASMPFGGAIPEQQLSRMRAKHWHSSVCSNKPSPPTGLPLLARTSSA